MKAQMARGADFESGNLLQRAKSMVPILGSALHLRLRRPDELATAMEARCYRGDVGRTRMKELHYGAPGRYRVPGSVAVCGGALCVPIFTGGFAVAPDGFVEGGHHAANLYNHQL